jgi:D-aminoacyl-tRNA deacylase
MKALIQRVNNAQVTVDNEVVGQIERGLLIFLGVEKTDTGAEIEYLVNKIAALRIFSNDEQKFDKSVQDVDGEVLIVSQFTLCADCSRGRRPDFINAAPPAEAEKLYEQFVEEFKKTGIKVATGKFGAYMVVNLENDGPVTLMLDKNSFNVESKKG